MKQDHISNALNSLKNASNAGHQKIILKNSKTVLKILKIFQQCNYISKVEKKNDRFLVVYIKYKGWWAKNTTFSKIVRISKPSLRKYSGYKSFGSYLIKHKPIEGVAVVSTSMGILNTKEAEFLKLGGELLCYIS